MESHSTGLAMRISAKAEYACLAMLELTVRRERPDPVRVAEIAERNQIPDRFLVQILLVLKGAGYVQSIRGAAGGYVLAVDPELVSLWDVIHLIDGPQTSGALQDAERKGTGWQVLQGVWRTVNQREESELKQTNFLRLAELTAEQGSNMFYI